MYGSNLILRTGYFAKVKTYANMGYALISIAKVAPWFLAKELRLYACELLKPIEDILVTPQPQQMEFF